MANVRGKNKYVFFVGIDISKETIDLTFIKDSKHLKHTCISNDHESIKSYLIGMRDEYKYKTSNTLFGLEKTGIYSNKLLNYLRSIKANIVVENPIFIKNNKENLRGKTDKLDSQRIAVYLRKNRDELILYQPRRPIIDHLASLCTLRTRLIKTRSILKVPLQENSEFVSKNINLNTIKHCQESIDAIQNNVEGIDLAIDAMCANDEMIKIKMKQIQSVPGIGKVTSLHILITTNEFRDISDPRKYASYCGIAPFPNQSGIGLSGIPRVSHFANKKIKSLLHNCVLTNLKSLPEFKAYYKRKTEVDKKHQMKVINALKFKLILRVFACVNEGRMYQKDYKPKPYVKPHKYQGLTIIKTLDYRPIFSPKIIINNTLPS